MVSKKQKKKEVAYPCSICKQNVNANHNAIVCSLCKDWSHKCNNVSKKQYKLHQLNPELSFFCIKCKGNNIPFMKLNDYDSFIKNGIENFQFNSFIPSRTQQEMLDKLNAEIDDYSNRVNNEEFDSDPNHQFTCKYYGINDFAKCRFSSSRNFSIMHLNIHSIQLHIDELNNLLTKINETFDIIKE